MEDHTNQNQIINDGQINAEIVRQRRRFKLKQFNLYNGEILLPLDTSLMMIGPAPGSLKEMTAEQAGKCKRGSQVMIAKPRATRVRRQIDFLRFSDEYPDCDLSVLRIISLRAVLILESPKSAFLT